jgi:hypothetical protein
MTANSWQVGGDHYKGAGYQHWDFTWDHQYNQFEYCITKYVERHKSKGGVEDLRKASHHLLKYIEKVGKSAPPPGCRSYAGLEAYLAQREFDNYQKEIFEEIYFGRLSAAEVTLENYVRSLL